MFLPFLVSPSSGWKYKIVRGTILQYSMIDSVSVSGGGRDLVYKSGGVCYLNACI
jgi:hypothetical protein